jgi:hypothetical protein
MEQVNGVSEQNAVESQTQTSPAPPASQPAASVQGEALPQGKKSTPVWAWLLGGCLIICLMALIGAIAIGWWGVRKVKHEIKKYEPGMERVQENLDKMNKEADEWQKKSEEMRSNLPNPDDFNQQIEDVK